jgi:hypothetical protein
MALRLSAAFRHWSQALVRQRGWLPDEWKCADADTGDGPSEKRLRKSRKTTDPQNTEELEKSEEGQPPTTTGDDASEPPDEMAQEIEEFLKESRTLQWQSAFARHLEAQMECADFAVMLSDLEPSSGDTSPHT